MRLFDPPSVLNLSLPLETTQLTFCSIKELQVQHYQSLSSSNRLRQTCYVKSPNTSRHSTFLYLYLSRRIPVAIRSSPIAEHSAAIRRYIHLSTISRRPKSSYLLELIPSGSQAGRVANFTNFKPSRLDFPGFRRILLGTTAKAPSPAKSHANRARTKRVST